MRLWDRRCLRSGDQPPTSPVTVSHDVPPRRFLSLRPERICSNRLVAHLVTLCRGFETHPGRGTLNMLAEHVDERGDPLHEVGQSFFVIHHVTHDDSDHRTARCEDHAHVMHDSWQVSSLVRDERVGWKPCGKPIDDLLVSQQVKHLLTRAWTDDRAS